MPASAWIARAGNVARRMLAGAFLVLLAGASCRGTGRWGRGDYTFLREAPRPEEIGRPISEPIVLVADNQRQGLLGGPVQLFRTGISDRMVSVAIRPPQLDYFGQDFLRFALEQAGDRFVLHLGDGCNVSTTTEFARFAWDMRRARGGWVMAPGNHDGFIYGNSSRKKESLLREWDEAAEHWFEDGVEIRGGALNKDRFVSFYLAALILEDQVWSPGLAATLGVEGERLFSRWRWERGTPERLKFSVYWRFLNEFERLVYRRGLYPEHHEDPRCAGYREFVLSEGPIAGRPHLRRLAWHIDADYPWKSYVTQEVDVSASSPAPGDGGASILVLDTAQYMIEPGLDYAVGTSIVTFGQDMKLAGTHGNILETQLDCALVPMVERMRAEGRRWVVAGHHPYRELSWYSRPRLDPLREAGGIPLYVSAHSHFGEYRWNSDDEREGAWPELNVGSVLDWPMEFRDFQLFLEDPGPSASIALRSRRVVVADALRARGLLLEEESRHRAREGDADYYLAYRKGISPFAGASELRVRRLLLEAMLRMFEAIPTDGPDQTSTRWPRDATGSPLADYSAVVDMIRGLLAAAGSGEGGVLEEITRLLYELRAYDETRNLTEQTRRLRTRYRYSQALWAAREEFSVQDGRTAEVDPSLSYIAFPARDPTGKGER